ncbi:MAG: 30S ribosomal protein S16 [Gemmatimonadota bacterium]
MAATIRLKRVGRKKQASYRIVVIDSARAGSGPALERLGTYNPRTSPSVIKLNAVRTLYWLHEGAQPSDTVRSLLRKTGVWAQYQAGTDAADADESVVFLGPAMGQQKTSQRPKPAAGEAAAAQKSPEPQAEAEAVEAAEEHAEEQVGEAVETAQQAPEAEPEVAQEPEPEAVEEPETAVEAEAAPDGPKAEVALAEAESAEEPALEEEKEEAEEA